MDVRRVYWKVKDIANRIFSYENLPHNYRLIRSAKLASFEREFREKAARNINLKIESEIRSDSPRALKAHARDYAFEQILNEGEATASRPYVAVNPYGLAPLTALLLFVTEEECKVKFTVPGMDGAADITDETGYTKRHRVSIYGLYPGRRNDVQLEIADRSGTVLNKRVMKIYPDRLPGKMGKILLEKNFHKPSAYENIFITGGAGLYPFAFDESCNVRYYLKAKTSSYGVFPLKNGRLLWGEAEIGVPTFANAHTCQMHEMDYMGRVYRTILVEKGMHHFATELPNGNIVGITNTIDGCTEDALIELDRETGKVVQIIDMRLFFGTEYRDMVDWVHPNHLQYNEEEDSMLVCLRNVHSVLKFRWSTKEIIWVLSIPEFWKGLPLEEKVLKPEGNEIFWNYQAHAAYELPRKEGQAKEIRRIMVFDNHRVNRRPCAQFNESSSSFINVYRVNETEHTVAMEKQLEIPKSLIRSNAVLDMESNHVFAMEGCLARSSEIVRGQVLEMDYETGEVINSCGIRRDFFSGFEFKFDYKGLDDPVGFEKQYITDELEAPLTTEVIAVPQQMLPKHVVDDFIIREEFLYVKATDHAIQKLYLIGKDHCYVKDYTNTWQTCKFHVDRKFYCVITLRDVETDDYVVAVQYKDQIYLTGRTMKIKNCK